MSNNKRPGSRHKKKGLDIQFITSCISTTLVLLLLGLVIFMSLGARNLSIYMRENLNVSIMLDDQMRESEMLKLQKELKAESFVKEAVYISKKQALKEQTEAMGTNPEEFLGYNPFTPSIEIHLNAGYANSDSIAVIEKALKKNTHIKDVLYQRDLIDMVNDNIRNISLVLLSLAVLLAIISFALINNTISLAIYSQRFLIHTMKLVGASWSFIRGPFLKRNVIGGLIAGIVADTLLMGMAYWLLIYEPSFISVVNLKVMSIVVVSVLLLGVVITYLCAFFSINKYLKMRAGDLYYI